MNVIAVRDYGGPWRYMRLNFDRSSFLCKTFSVDRGAKNMVIPVYYDGNHAGSRTFFFGEHEMVLYEDQEYHMDVQEEVDMLIEILTNVFAIESLK